MMPAKGPSETLGPPVGEKLVTSDQPRETHVVSAKPPHISKHENDPKHENYKKKTKVFYYNVISIKSLHI